MHAKSVAFALGERLQETGRNGSGDQGASLPAPWTPASLSLCSAEMQRNTK
jgi:hypothetical protein